MHDLLVFDFIQGFDQDTALKVGGGRGNNGSIKPQVKAIN